MKTNSLMPRCYCLDAHQICSIGSALQAPGNDRAPVLGRVPRYKAMCGRNMGLLMPGYSNKNIKVWDNGGIMAG